MKYALSLIALFSISSCKNMESTSLVPLPASNPKEESTSTTSNAAVNQTTISKGLVAYYPFDNNSSDYSGKGNHGSSYGATPTSDRFGRPNRAYNFNGMGQYIQVPRSPSLEPAEEITISFWMYGKPGYDGMQRIVRKAAHVSSGYMVSFTNADNRLDFRASNSDLSCITKYGVERTNYLNRWLFVTATYSKKTHSGKFYIDGQLSSTTTNACYEMNHADDLYIGNFRQNEGFEGSLDDLRIYDRVLSEAEIKILYKIR